MQYPPATIVWVPAHTHLNPQFRLQSPEWLHWDLAQVVGHYDGSWSSRVGIHRPTAFIPAAKAPNEHVAMRWAETWVRRNWARIEAELIEKANRGVHRLVDDYRVFAGRGLAPPRP